MKATKGNRFISEQFYVNIDGEAQEVVEKLALQIAEKKAAGWTDLRLAIDADEYDAELMVYGSRPETTEELNKRLAIELKTAERNRKAKENEEAREKKELARLKAKYESEA